MLQVPVRIRGGSVISSESLREKPFGNEYPVLQAEVLDESGKPINGGVIQIPLSNENKAIVGRIMETGTLTITIP